MRLRTKILVGTGTLLLCMLVIMYILPAYFVKKDVYTAAKDIDQLLVEDHTQLINNQKIWIRNLLEKGEQNINALLLMLSQDKELTRALVFEKNKDQVLWHAMSKVASLDPDIGIIQVHDPKKNQAFVIKSSSAPLYKASNLRKQNGTYELSLLRDEQENSFIAIPLPQELQKKEGNFYYALFAKTHEKQNLTQIEERLQKALMDFTDQEQDFSFPVDSATKMDWVTKLGLIRLLTFFSDAEKGWPTGLAQVNAKGEGFAILGADVFSSELLFDDAAYYKKFAPEKGSSKTLATGSALILDKKMDAAFLGNTLLLDDSTYVTLGFSLDALVKNLALASNKTILAHIAPSFWIGFNGKGEKIQPQFFNRYFKEATSLEGVLLIEGTHYTLNNLSSFANAKLQFYELHGAGTEKTILERLTDLENRLSKRISLQLSIMSLIAMLVVLAFILRIGLSIVKPVTKLAQATEKVASGRYEEISLPEVGKREDEVAMLTHSFASMVKGLQEREKIRGVLDKVVSKDVADEILRTQIHLGGEDRIVTMLFSDVRGFTRITQNLAPQQTIEILNACMTKISRVIEGEGGVIDKYVGDEVMAIFGAPTSHPDHALRAVSTGILIKETLKKWNEQRKKEFLPPIEMGIGIHTGLVVAGNMGAEDRLNYTVLGANVNIAARLCEIAEPNQLIISEGTLAQPNVEDSFQVSPLAPITLKGFTKPINIYEVTGFKWEKG